jgi:hypothetical protein
LESESFRNVFEEAFTLTLALEVNTERVNIEDGTTEAAVHH